MKNLAEYVALHLTRELNEVRQSRILEIESNLNVEERTPIYKYTEDGYENLNQNLRASEGVNISEFGKLLDKTLAKLPNYEDIAFRSADLTNLELQKYLFANENNIILVEHSFVSASKSKEIAYAFGKKCRFRIFSRTGKDIEGFAKYGLHHPQNEKEILFRPNSKFRILEVTNSSGNTFITMEEVKR